MAIRPTAGSPTPVILATSSQAEETPTLAPEASNPSQPGVPSPSVRIAARVRRFRGRHLLVIDSVGIALATVVALLFRYDPITQSTEITALLPLLLALMLTVRTVTDGMMGLYQRDWRHASIDDLRRIALTAFLGTLVAATIVLAQIQFGARVLPSIPRGFWPIEFFLTCCVLGGSRLAIRMANDHIAAAQAPHASTDAPVRTLLYGAGRVGVLMVRSAARNPAAAVLPVGFLDDDRAMRGTRVADLRVLGGLGDMEAAAVATGATALLITMPSARGAVVRRIVERAMELGLEVRTVPALEHLLDGTVDAYRVRRVNVEDLLRRPTSNEHSPIVSEAFSGKVVMITGAAGSIGSELARQVHALHPRRLILLDRSESPLYLVQRDLEERSELGLGGGEIVPHLGNVVSRTAMARLVMAEKPDVILHAAAYKHVPMLESHPADAVHVNVAGTMSVLDAAAAAGVERFVLVSTDKAVKPSSVMGASKRVAEMLVLDTARRLGKPYVAVRFGNVLGSAGSVVPIFQEQLENGRPLTITHPEMTRFFMTIPEAAWLILDAASIGASGDLFVLDMGEPVKILDLARDVTRLAGRDPESQPIQVMGLRPGEKLHEELFYASERVEATEMPKVKRVNADPPPADVREQAWRLVSAASEDEDILRGMVHACARGELGADAGEIADTVPLVPVMETRARTGVAVSSEQVSVS